MLSEYTVTIDVFGDDWRGQGVRPIWHTLVEASSRDEAVRIGKKTRDGHGHALPPTAKVRADPRCL